MNNDQPSASEAESDERNGETCVDRARLMLRQHGTVSRDDEDRLDIIEDLEEGSDEYAELVELVKHGDLAGIREIADNVAASVAAP